MKHARSRTRWLGMSTALVIALSTGTASAEMYVGALYGWAEGDHSDFEDSTANGWRAVFGGRGTVIGWEIGYAEIEEFRDTSLGRIDISGVDVSLLAGIPLGPFWVFGTAGAVLIDVQPEIGSSDDEWSYKYGVGADVNLGQSFGLRFAWNRYEVDSNFIDADVDTASVGVLFRF